MATVRETMQARIVALEAEVAAARADLAAAETKTATWLELETQSVKEFFALLGKHL